MPFFKNLFAKNNYSNVLGNEANECSHCHDTCHKKLQKCQECGCRSICKTCYKHKDLILCKTCDDSYNQWVNKVQNTKTKSDKEQKYGIKNTKAVSLL